MNSGLEAVEDAHLKAIAQEAVGQVGADEAGAASDQHFHWINSLTAEHAAGHMRHRDIRRPPGARCAVVCQAVVLIFPGFIFPGFIFPGFISPGLFP
jgi:hypothetical protein